MIFEYTLKLYISRPRSHFFSLTHLVVSLTLRSKLIGLKKNWAKISCFCTFNDRRDGDIRKKIMMTTYLLICFLSLRVPFRRIAAFSLISTIVLCSCLRNWKHVYTRSLTLQNLIWKWSTQYHSASTVWASSPHIFCLKGSVMTFLGIYLASSG